MPDTSPTMQTEQSLKPYLYFLLVSSAAVLFGIAVGACNTRPGLVGSGGNKSASRVGGDAPQKSELSDTSDKKVTGMAINESTATFAAGCFWCVEAVLEEVEGVLDVSSGYIGGRSEQPTYREVCSGSTGHAEAVQVRFDPNRISYRELLEWFFALHDPTTLNRQGGDIGTQYRSAIFWHDEEQRVAAEAAIQAHQAVFGRPIVTEVTEATTFWPAEVDHQDYFRLNPNAPYCRAVIAPKLQKLKAKQGDAKTPRAK